MNRTAHVLTGVAVGLYASTLPVAPTGVAGRVAWVAATAGYSTAPDLDHPKSAAARMWGPVSRAAAWLLWRVFGHRNTTHWVLAWAVTWVLVWASLTGQAVPWLSAGLARLGAPEPASWAALAGDAAWALTVAVSIGLALTAARIDGWLNLAVSWLGTGLVHVLGLPLTWLPYSAALGVAAHLAGDFITKRGLPLWPGKRVRVPVVSITTGKHAETVICLILCAAIAAYPYRGAVAAWTKGLIT